MGVKPSWGTCARSAKLRSRCDPSLRGVGGGEVEGSGLGGGLYYCYVLLYYIIVILYYYYIILYYSRMSPYRQKGSLDIGPGTSGCKWGPDGHFASEKVREEW